MSNGRYELLIKWPSGQSTLSGEITDQQYGEICRVLSPDRRAELAAIKAGQGEAVEFCCEASFEAAKQEAWTARDLKLCTCDHHEYCGHCWPDDFKPGGKWHDGFLVKQQHQVASPPASADAVSVPRELLHRLCPKMDARHWHQWNASEAYQAACELRALLAQQESKP